MKTILFPTDFSPVAGNALRFACLMAEQLEAGIALLHVYHPHLLSTDLMPHPVVRSLERQDREAALQYFQTYAQQHLGEQVGRVSIDLHIDQGYPVEKTVALAERLRPDLIVMGTTGASNLAEDVFGSTTSSVMQQVQCPVLAIPHSAHYGAIKRIAFATDFLQADFRQVGQLFAFAHIMEAEVIRIHISSEETDLSVLQEENQHTWPFANTPLHVIADKHVIHGLEAFSEANSIDLIALIPHKRSFWEQWWHPSLTRRMLLHAHTPVLAVKP